jgi:hypothetical protein
MTFLPSQSTRDALNIDTLERAIAFAAPLLMAANQDLLNSYIGADHPYYKAIEMAIEQDKFLSGLLRIKAGIPINKINFLQAGLGILDAILEFSPYVNILNIPTPLTSAASNVTNHFYPMPGTPSNVDSLEKYFVWASLLWRESIGQTANSIPVSTWIQLGLGGPIVQQQAPALSESEKYTREATIQLDLNGDYPRIVVEITLPVASAPLAKNQGLLDAVIAVGSVPPY